MSLPASSDPNGTVDEQGCGAREDKPNGSKPPKVEPPTSSKLLHLPLEIRRIIWRSYLEDHSKDDSTSLVTPLQKVCSSIRAEVLPLWCSITLSYRKRSKHRYMNDDRCTKAEYVVVEYGKRDLDWLEATILLCYNSAGNIIAFNTKPRLLCKETPNKTRYLRLEQLSARLASDGETWHMAQTRSKVEGHSPVVKDLMALALDTFMATREKSEGQSADQGFPEVVLDAVLFRVHAFYESYFYVGRREWRVPPWRPW